MVTTREVSYPADELIMVGHLARPEGHGPWPTVLLAHDGIGLNDFQRHYADDLAERGYLTLAMEYHGGRWFSDPDEMLARCLPLIADPDRMQAIGRAALEVLLAEPSADPGPARRRRARYWWQHRPRARPRRSGVPGPRRRPPRCAVRERAGLDRDARHGAPVHRSEDPLCTPDQLLGFTRVLQDADGDWRVNVYGGAKHAFWHPPVHEHEALGHAGHHPRSARRVWVDVLALLDEHLPTTI